jgi:Tfp pilus assembly protein PilN
VRPVNLIPQEERATAGGTGASGVAGYVIIGFLVLAIAVVAYITSLGNKIDEHKADIASLQGQVEQSQARASALQPYVELATVRQARTVTIDSLAKSRFDWERVLRELAKVTTPSISLSNLTGTVAPDVDVEGAADVSLRDQVPGPALEITGCATSQRTLADFVAALHDIDGVTRVAAETSAKADKPDKQAGATSDQAPTAQTTGECARPKDTNFQLVAAFDAVPTPSEPAIGSTGSTTVTATGATDDGGVAAEQASQAAQQQQINNASQQSQDAANLAPGG